jgi:hypothetical protein
MKIDFHSHFMAVLMDGTFFHTLTALGERLKSEDKKIKKVQCYCEYCNKDGEFLFADDTHYYYPLTLIYRDNSHRIHWVCWKRTFVPQGKKLMTPFCALIDAEHFEMFDCAAVPPEIEKMLAETTSVFIQNPKHASHGVMYCGGYFSLGKIHTTFLDEMARQVSEQLIKLVGEDLNPVWQLILKPDEETVRLDGLNYHSVIIQRRFLDYVRGALCWKGPYDVYDDISGKDITFTLTDRPIRKSVKPMEVILDFVRRENRSFHGSNLVPDHYPDVTLRFVLKKRANPEESADEILSRLDAYVEAWNNNPENEEPIHTFFPVDPEEEGEYTVFVDFGSADPMALLNLLKDLRRHPPTGVKKILL